MRIRRPSGRRQAPIETRPGSRPRLEQPDPPPAGALAPGVRGRRDPRQARELDWNERLRRSLRAGTGAPFWRT